MPAQPKSDLRTRAQDRARQHRQDAKARRACTDVVWGGHDVEHGNCAHCGAFVLRASAYPMYLGHVLGGDPTDPANTELLCVRCHMTAHHQRQTPLPFGAHRRSVRASQ